MNEYLIFTVINGQRHENAALGDGRYLCMKREARRVAAIHCDRENVDSCAVRVTSSKKTLYFTVYQRDGVLAINPCNQQTYLTYC